MQRTVPPWFSSGTRTTAFAIFIAVPVWITFGFLAYAIADRAPVLQGRVISVSETRNRRGTLLLRIQYTYDDQVGESHAAFRDLVPDAARDAGLTTVGAPLKVKIVFGEPFVQGAPNVLVAFPFLAGGIFLILAISLGAVHRHQMKKIALVMEGKLVRGTISSVSILEVRGVQSWTIRYEYPTPAGVANGSDLLPASQVEGPLAAFGLARMPQAGDPIWVAFDPKAPRRSAAYSLEASLDADGGIPQHALALPPDLARPAPRPLLADAPSIATEVPAFGRALGVGALVLFGLGPVLYAFVAKSPDAANETLMVGSMTFFVLLTLFVGFYWDIVRRRRKVLRNGEATAAVITHVDARGARVWISFEASTAHGRARGRESIRASRLNKMTSKPVTGGRVYLVTTQDSPDVRVIWGFDS